MKIALLLIITISLTNYSTVFAATAEQLLDNCRFAIRVHETGSPMSPGEKRTPVILGERATKAGFCIGFISGFVGAGNIYNEFGEGRKIYCVPDNTTWTQGAKIIIKYLENNPADLSSSDVFVTTVALKKAFPCKE